MRDLTDEQPVIIYLETGKETQIVSASAFRTAVSHYAAALNGLGISKGNLVIIAHTQSLESIYLFWGALAAGAVPSMFPTLTEKLDPDIYYDSMRELVQLSRVKAILTTPQFAADLGRTVGCPVYDSDHLRLLEVSRIDDQISQLATEPDEIAFLQHSSGTTGLQKGVALSHRSVLNQLAAYSDAIKLADDDVIVSWLPLYHDMGLIAGFILPIFQGVPLVLMSPFDWVRHPGLLFRAINDFEGTLCWQPNFAYNHCARRIRERDIQGLSAASMRMFVNCSEPASKESHDLFLERFSPLGVSPEMLGVSYAMAENTFGVSQTVPRLAPLNDTVDRRALEVERKAVPIDVDSPFAVTKVSCGPPIDGTFLQVVDDGGAELDNRQVGEIAIKSDCMLSEYYMRPDLEPFNEGWYLTGDIGYLADGQVYIIGRSKDLIINAGKNIYPQDLEAIVNEIPGVIPGRVAAFGIYDQKEGTELIVIAAETEVDDPESKISLAATIRREVAQHSLVTVSYVKLAGPKWLLKTSSGKIARGANREKWMAEQKNQAP